MHDIARAREALSYIDAGCPRQEWAVIGMAAKDAGLDVDDFIAWSRNASNFGGEKDCKAAWKSFKPGKTTAATLFAKAIAAGWKPPPEDDAKPAKRPQAARKPEPKAERPTFDFAAVWRDSEAATATHPYIARKLGLSDGLRVVPAASTLTVNRQSVAGWLAVPLYDGGELASLQFIGPDGGKLTAPGPMRGWFTVGEPVKAGATVYVCEGIGQGWAAHQATQAPAVVAFGVGRMMGTAKALTERGARVVLVADVGTEDRIEEAAKEIGCAWIAPPADLGRNGDLNDLHQRDGLQAVAALLAKPNEPPGPRFRVMTADELAALPPVRWRVRGALPAEGIAAIYGPAGSGKTFLTLDLLGAVADGREWFAHRVESCAVVYVALEGEAGIAQRVQAYRTRHGRAPARMRFIAQPFALLEAGDVAELAQAIRAAGGAGGIVAIDTLNRAAPGADENDSRDMGRIIEGAKLLQAALGCLVLLIHHAGKDAGRGLRGHSSLMAALDAVLEVSRDGDRREWRLAKAKDASDGEAHPFRLEVVELGTDDDGEPITSCVVAEAEAGEARRPAPAGGNQRVAWDRIGELLREAGPVRPAGAPPEIPPGRPAVTLEAATDAVAARLVCDSKRRRERATDAIRGLVGRGLLSHAEGWLWCA